MQDHNAPPVNPLPMVVWALALPMIAMEVVLGLGEAGIAGGPGAIGWRVEAITQAAVVPELWREMWALGQFPPEHLARFLAYPFVHGSLTHAVFGVVILLALGKFVGEVLRWWAIALIFVASGVMGGLVYASLTTSPMPLFGAYPADYGLVGGFTYLMWLRLAGTGARQYRAFAMIGTMLGIQLIFGLLFDGSGQEWIADFTGFAVGFVMTVVLVPGGISHLRDRIRQR